MTAPRRHLSRPIQLPPAERIRASRRAVLQFDGVDQAGPSFEARVFLNNPDADEDTPTTPDNGYAGSFHVYGYGLDALGHATDPRPLPESPSPARPARLPMRRGLVATDAVARAAARDSTAIVTVVPVVPGAPRARGLEDVVPFESVSLTVDPPAGANEAART